MLQCLNVIFKCFCSLYVNRWTQLCNCNYCISQETVQIKTTSTWSFKTVQVYQHADIQNCKRTPFTSSMINYKVALAWTAHWALISIISSCLFKIMILVEIQRSVQKHDQKVQVLEEKWQLKSLVRTKQNLMNIYT